MCDMGISMGIMMAATSAMAAFSQASAQSKQAKFASAQAERNAQIATQQAGILESAAQREEQYAQEQARLIREKGRGISASNRANLAHSGIDFSGSSYDIFNQNTTATELDAAKAINQGDVAAYNKRVQGTSAQNDALNFQNQSEFYQSQSKIDYLSIGAGAVASGVGGYMSAGGTFGSTTPKSSGLSPVGPYKDVSKTGYGTPSFMQNLY